MQEKEKSSESSEQNKKINLKELRAQILSMKKESAMDYVLGEAWFRTPRPFQIAILKRAGWNWMEMYIAASIENLGRKDNLFYESCESIGELMGVSPRTVRKAGSRLKARGILNREGKKGERHREWKWMDSDNIDGKSETRLETNAMISVIDPGTIVTSTKEQMSHQKEQMSHQPRNKCHVDLGTNVTPHNNRKDLKKKEKNKKEDKEESIPSFSGDSSFKKEDKDKAKARGYLNDFVLLNSTEFCKSYFGLLKMFKKENLTEQELDFEIASECLDSKVPKEFRCQAILAEWMIWYVLTPPRPDEHPYFTNFKKSWEDFSPIAIDLLEAITAPERQQREAEAKASQEQQDKEDEEERILMEEQHRQRQEQAKADEEVRRQKAIEEEEARKKRAAEELEAKRRKAEEFHRSLPTPEAIRQAVYKVPLTPNWLDNQFGYLNFMNAMLASVPFLNLTAPIGSEYFNYTPLARDSFCGDNLAFERKSRDFVAAEVEIAIGELKARGLSQFPKQTLDWKRFAEFFGIPEDARYERPKTMVAVGAEGKNESPFGEKDEQDD